MWVDWRWEKRAGDPGFSPTSPSGGEQMLDPQASTSMEPLKLSQLQTCWDTHKCCIPHAHRHTCICTYVCVYMLAQANQTISIPLYCMTRSWSGVNAQWSDESSVKYIELFNSYTVGYVCSVFVFLPLALIRVNTTLDYDDNTGLLILHYL